MAKRRKRTRVTTDPDVAAIQGLVREASRSTRQRIRTADAAATGLRSALEQRSGQLEHAYTDVENVGRQASDRATAALASLGSSADPYKAIVAGEQASGLRRNAEARSRGREEVGRIGTSIEREKSSRTAQAGADFQETLRQLAGKAAEAGSERAKQEAQDQLARARIRATRRGQTLSHRDRQKTNARENAKFEAQRKNKTGPFAPPSKNTSGSKGGGGKSGGKVTGSTDFGRALSVARKLAGPQKFRGKSVKDGRGIRRRAKDTLVSSYGINSSVALQAIHKVAFGKRKPFKG